MTDPTPEEVAEYMLELEPEVVRAAEALEYPTSSIVEGVEETWRKIAEGAPGDRGELGHGAAPYDLDELAELGRTLGVDSKNPERARRALAILAQELDRSVADMRFRMQAAVEALNRGEPVEW